VIGQIKKWKILGTVYRRFSLSKTNQILFESVIRLVTKLTALLINNSQLRTKNWTQLRIRESRKLFVISLKNVQLSLMSLIKKMVFKIFVVIGEVWQVLKVVVARICSVTLNFFHLKHSNGSWICTFRT